MVPVFEYVSSRSALTLALAALTLVSPQRPPPPASDPPPVRELGDDVLRIQPRALGFVEGGATLVVADDHAIRYLDLATGREREGPSAHLSSLLAHAPSPVTDAFAHLALPLEDAPPSKNPDAPTMRPATVRAAASSPSRARVALALKRGGVLVFDGPGAPMRRIDVTARDLAFVGEDRLAVLSASGASIIELATGATLRTVPTALHAHVTVSPDGRTLASWGTHTGVQLWDVATGAERLEQTGHRGAIRAIALDGSTVLTGANDGTIRVWDARTGDQLRVIEVGEPIAGLAVGGGKIASNAYQRVDLWQLADGAPLARTAPLGGSNTNETIAFAPDGAIEYGDEGTLYRWDPAHGTNAHAGEPARRADAPPEAARVARATDGSIVASVDLAGTITWIDHGIRRELRPWGEVEVTALAVSTDGMTLAAGAADGRVIVWRPRSAEPRARARGASPASPATGRSWRARAEASRATITSGATDPHRS